MDLKQQLIQFEGREHQAYPDPLTRGDPWTIGVGATGPGIRRGTTWSDEQIDKRLDADIEYFTQQCRNNLPWFDRLNEPRQAVLVGMAFQMGVAGLLKFVQTLASIRDERYEHAAEQMRQSAWAHQTPKRAIRLAQQMANGEWT